ncbi:hypothetical protein BTVI_14631 [Pitangus sulphuratus]|nr:hypothetical protein BTVI_14631 [Pitangus sulphuratus]
MPVGSEVDLRLAKTEPISDDGSTTGLMYLRREEKNWNSNCSWRRIHIGELSLGRRRPVSLTSVPGKVMEKIILGSTEKHLKDDAVVGHIQYSFMRGKSCLSKLISFYNKLGIYEKTLEIYEKFSVDGKGKQGVEKEACELSG